MSSHGPLLTDKVYVYTETLDVTVQSVKKFISHSTQNMRFTSAAVQTTSEGNLLYIILVFLEKCTSRYGVQGLMWMGRRTLLYVCTPSCDERRYVGDKNMIDVISEHLVKYSMVVGYVSDILQIVLVPICCSYKFYEMRIKLNYIMELIEGLIILSPHQHYMKPISGRRDDLLVEKYRTMYERLYQIYEMIFVELLTLQLMVNYVLFS